MSETFNYENVFMGAYDVFREDYRLKSLIESVKLIKGNMLDIGCGGGVLTEIIAQRFPHVDLYGCDISERSIAYAKKLGNGKVQYSIMRGKKLPYKAAFFDVCVCLDVLEHVPNVGYFLKEVRRVLKKNGQFFLLVPCEGQPFTFTWILQKLGFGNTLTLKNWGHVHPEFTHTYVSKLLDKHGFIPLRKTYSGHVLYQFDTLFLYLFPRELLLLFLQAKAVDYLDRGVVIAREKRREKQDFMMLVRNMWLAMRSVVRSLVDMEARSFKSVPFAAWKIHILARKVS